jgi:hypothetical protein
MSNKKTKKDKPKSRTKRLSKIDSVLKKCGGRVPCSKPVDPHAPS